MSGLISFEIRSLFCLCILISEVYRFHTENKKKTERYYIKIDSGDVLLKKEKQTIRLKLKEVWPKTSGKTKTGPRSY